MSILRFIAAKRRYRQYRARIQQLPEGYAAAAGALERYLSFFGPGRSDNLLSMLEDLAELFEQGAADGTSVRTIVGEEPVEFAEAFLRNYPEGQWINGERRRLVQAIDRASAERR